jgi:N-acetylneuraminate synthase/N,N'-diacetyllegionaminate synthase
MAEESIAYGANIFKCQYFDVKRMGNAWQHMKPFYEKCQLDINSLTELYKHVSSLGAELLVTVNSPNLFENVYDIGIKNVKIASGQILPEMIKELKKYSWNKVFVSTGMLFDSQKLYLLEEINAAEKIVMHCTSLYPPMETEQNINRIKFLKNYFSDEERFRGAYEIGYSDHSDEDLPCILAIGSGAKHIERHVVTAGCYGPTSEIARDMKSFDNFCALVKRADLMMGNGQLLSQERERATLKKYETRWLT